MLIVFIWVDDPWCDRESGRNICCYSWSWKCWRHGEKEQERWTSSWQEWQHPILTSHTLEPVSNSVMPFLLANYWICFVNFQSGNKIVWASFPAAFPSVFYGSLQFCCHHWLHGNTIFYTDVLSLQTSKWCFSWVLSYLFFFFSLILVWG